jgi:hypothetical protein
MPSLAKWRSASFLKQQKRDFPKKAREEDKAGQEKARMKFGPEFK